MTKNQPASLRDIALAAKRKHEGGGRKLARIATHHGHKITATTIDAILAGKYTSRPSVATLDALAYLSGEAKATVYAAAGVPYGDVPLADQLPPGVDELGQDERAALIEMARALVKVSRREQDLRRQVDGLGADWEHLNPGQRAAVRQVMASMVNNAPDGWATSAPTPRQGDLGLAADTMHGPSAGQALQSTIDGLGEESQDPGGQP